MFYTREYKALKSFECFCWGGEKEKGSDKKCISVFLFVLDIDEDLSSVCVYISQTVYQRVNQPNYLIPLFNTRERFCGIKTVK